MEPHVHVGPSLAPPSPHLTRRRLIVGGSHSGAATLTAVAASSLLGACAQESAPAAQTIGPASLSFHTWETPPSPSGVAAEKAVAAFQVATPNISVRIEPILGPAAETLTRVQTLLAAGTPPDVVQMRPQFMAALHRAGALTNLDPLMARDKSLTRDRFFKAALTRLTFDNRLHGLPSDFHFQVLYFNRALFDGAGVKAPDASWTWDTYLESAKKLTTASGGAALPGAAGGSQGGDTTQKQFGAVRPDWQVRVWDNGGDILDSKLTTCLLDGPRAVEGIQWAADTVLRHQVAPTVEDLGAQNVTNRFLAGRVAMYPIGIWWHGRLAPAGFRWDLVPLPKGRAGRRPLAGGASIFIPTGTKTVDASWVFLKYMGGPEGNTFRGRDGGLFPTMPEVVKPEIITMFGADHIKTILSTAPDATQLPYNPKYPEMEKIINEGLAGVWTGQATAQQAAANIVPQVNNLLKSG